MYTIVLTENDIVNADNNSLEYTLPPGTHFEKASLALASVHMYYSWDNISSSLGNNTMTITVPPLVNDATGQPVNSDPAQTFTITFPNGMYDYQDLEYFLQQTFIQRKLYLIDNTTGENVYFFQLQINPTRYACQINLWAMPTYLDTSKYSEPEGGFFGVSLFPAVETAGDGAIVYPVLGYNVGLGTFVKTVGAPFVTSSPGYSTAASSFWDSSPINYCTTAFPAGAISFLSTKAPDIQPNNVIFLNCNLLSNRYAQVNTAFLAPIPADVGFGELITVEPPSYAFMHLNAGYASKLRFTFTTKNNAPIVIKDGNMVITLIIKDQSSEMQNMAASLPGGVSQSPMSQEYARHPFNNNASSQHMTLGRR
jgi:hypothetical protein